MRVARRRGTATFTMIEGALARERDACEQLDDAVRTETEVGGRRAGGGVGSDGPPARPELETPPLQITARYTEITSRITECLSDGRNSPPGRARNPLRRQAATPTIRFHPITLMGRRAEPISAVGKRIGREKPFGASTVRNAQGTRLE